MLSISGTSKGSADSLDIFLHWIGRARRGYRHGRQHLMRVRQSSEDALDLGNFERQRRRLDILLHWDQACSPTRPVAGGGISRGAGEAASTIPLSGPEATLDSCGRSRCVDHDPRSAVFDAARTEANEPSSNPTVENERSAQHREYGVSLRAHCPSPCYLIKGSTEAKPDRHQTNLIFGSKCGRAQDKNYKLSSFSRCVA